MKHADRVVFIEWATIQYNSCGATLTICYRTSRNDRDPVVRAATRAALDQLRLEELLGFKVRKYGELGFYYDDADPATTDAILLDLIVGRFNGSGVGCPGECMHASARNSPTSTAMLRARLGVETGSGALHHIVSQDIGNIIKHGFVQVHSADNTIVLGAADHIRVHQYSGSGSMYDSQWGITNAQARTALTFGQQFVTGQHDLQALGLL